MVVGNRGWCLVGVSCRATVRGCRPVGVCCPSRGRLRIALAAFPWSISLRSCLAHSVSPSCLFLAMAARVRCPSFNTSVRYLSNSSCSVLSRGGGGRVCLKQPGSGEMGVLLCAGRYAASWSWLEVCSPCLRCCWGVGGGGGRREGRFLRGGGAWRVRCC